MSTKTCRSTDAQTARKSECVEVVRTRWVVVVMTGGWLVGIPAIRPRRSSRQSLNGAIEKPSRALVQGAGTEAGLVSRQSHGGGVRVRERRAAVRARNVSTATGRGKKAREEKCTTGAGHQILLTTLRYSTSHLALRSHARREGNLASPASVTASAYAAPPSH